MSFGYPVGAIAFLSCLCSDGRLRTDRCTVKKSAQAELIEIDAGVVAAQQARNGFARAGPDAEPMSTKSRRDIKTGKTRRLINHRYDIRRRIYHTRPGFDNINASKLWKNLVNVVTDISEYSLVWFWIQHPGFLKG